jgi:hypothetical protein
MVFGITTVPTKMEWVIHGAGAVPLHIMVSMVLVCMVFLRDCRSSASFEKIEIPKYFNQILASPQRELLETFIL